MYPLGFWKFKQRVSCWKQKKLILNQTPFFLQSIKRNYKIQLVRQLFPRPSLSVTALLRTPGVPKNQIKSSKKFTFHRLCRLEPVLYARGNAVQALHWQKIHFNWANAFKTGAYDIVNAFVTQKWKEIMLYSMRTLIISILFCFQRGGIIYNQMQPWKLRWKIDRAFLMEDCCCNYWTIWSNLDFLKIFGFPKKNYLKIQTSSILSELS